MEIRLLYGNELQWAVYTANEVFGRSVRPYVETEEEIERYHAYVCVEHLWQEMSAGRLGLWGAFENGQMCAVGAMQSNGQITMLYVLPQYGGRHIGSRLLDEMCGYAAASFKHERVVIHVPRTAPLPYFYHVGFRPVSDAAAGGSYMLLERRIWTVQQSGYVGNPAYGNGYYGNPNSGYAGAPGYGETRVSGYAGAPQQGWNNPGNGGMGAPEYTGTPQQGWGNPGYSGAPYAGWNNPGYAGYGRVPQKPKKPEVTYPVKKVRMKTILRLTAATLVLVTAIFAGVTVVHMAEDGLKTEADYWDEDSTEMLPEGLGEPEEI